MGGYAVVRTDANHHLFEIANVSMHIAPVRTQIEYRVSDYLSWPVIRHITATAGFMHLYPVHGQLPVAGAAMRTAVAADAKGNHRGTLEKEQQVWNTTGAALFDKRLLQIERLAIWN